MFLPSQILRFYLVLQWYWHAGLDTHQPQHCFFFSFRFPIRYLRCMFFPFGSTPKSISLNLVTFFLLFSIIRFNQQILTLSNWWFENWLHSHWKGNGKWMGLFARTFISCCIVTVSVFELWLISEFVLVYILIQFSFMHFHCNLPSFNDSIQN